VPVYVIGLDGLDHELISGGPIQSILEKYDVGFNQMESVVPPITVPAWACGFSGLEPDRLECFDFQYLGEETKRFAPVNREKLSCHGYWNHTQYASALFDVPGATEPGDDGCYVGGIFDFGEMDTIPEKLKGELREDVGSTEIKNIAEMGSEIKRREEAQRIFDFRREIFEWLVENRDEDVLFPVFRLPDTTMHHTDSEDDMLDAYDRVASFLERFFEHHIDEEDDVIIVSDHGAVRYEREFHANAWLEENGFLVRKGGRQSLFEDIVLSVADVGRKLGLRDFLVKLNSLAERTVDKDFSPGKSNLMESLEWEKTEAFAYVTGVCAYGGIWINDERLEGVVDEVESKKSEIARRLEAREEVVWVRDSAEVYEDPPESFPDLVVRLDERTKFESSLHPKTVSEVSGFMHRKQGFIASNRELRDEPELVDLAPTILDILGDTVPKHMEGESMLRGEVEEESKETSGIDF
jgi:predicted AlkP superfamily phosphohydrolase/phosphomutase